MYPLGPRHSKVIILHSIAEQRLISCISFLDAACGYSFALSSVLAFSATHMAWLTRSPETDNLAYHHRGIALKGLQEAIGNFSEENSDAVLAASILLSWQASDW